MTAYLITDPKLYTDDPDIFSNRLYTALKTHSVSFTCYRNKTLQDTEHHRILAEHFLKLCKDSKVSKVMLNSDIRLASILGFGGVHLTSKQIEEIPDAKKRGLFTIVSTHTSEEISRCEALGADMVTFSPVFTSPGKGNPVGIQTLRKAVELTSLPVIALGGIISQKQIDQIQATGAHGFASIRYFIPEDAPPLLPDH